MAKHTPELVKVYIWLSAILGPSSTWDVETDLNPLLKEAENKVVKDKDTTLIQIQWLN